MLTEACKAIENRTKLEKNYKNCREVYKCLEKHAKL